MILILRLTIAAVFLSVTFAAKAEKKDTIGRTLQEFTLIASPSQSLIRGRELQGKELERLSAVNVADAVKFFSGVQLKDYGGVGGVKTLDVRSLGSSHLGVFYDGIALGNAQNGQIDLGRYSLDNIESLTLYNGQKSDLFSTARDLGSAGALYLRTCRPKFVPGKPFNLKARIRGGSFGLVNPSLNIDYQFSSNLSATLSAEYTRASGRYRFRLRGYYPDGSLAWDTSAVRQNGDVEAIRAELSFFGRHTRGNYMLKGYYYDSERGIPGAIVNNVWKNSQRQWDRNIHFQGNWKGELSNRLALMVNGKYARDYMHYLNPDTTQRYVDNHFHQDEIYASVASRVIAAGGLSFNGALDYQYNSLNSTLIDFVFPRRHTVIGAIAGRWRRNRLGVQGNILVNHIHDIVHPSVSSTGGSGAGSVRHNRKTAFSGGIFVNWQPWSVHQFRIAGFAKKSFRMPTFNDLYYTDIGNASLNPEYVVQYDLSFSERIEFERTVWQYFEAKVEAYHNRVKDKIIAVPKGNSQYRWKMMNIGRVRIYGVEAAAEASMSPLSMMDIGLKLQYAFQRAMDYSDPSDSEDEYGTYKGQISYIPLHSGSVNLFCLWRSLEMNWSFLYVGGRWRTSSNTKDTYEKPWNTTDMTLAYTLKVHRVSLRLQFEVNNIFDRQYHVILNYPMPGRNWRLGLTADF